MENIRVEVADRVGHLSLCRPDVAHAIDLPTARALGEAVRDLERSPGVGAILVSGAGPRFCAGGDALAMAAAPGPSSYVRELAGELDSALQRLAAATKPVVCAVQGAVAGAGLAVMLSCDIAIALRPRSS